MKKGVLKKRADLKPQLLRVWKLSVPAVLTQITTIAMQYIDSAMVGHLGANASAAIGLVSTTTWMMGGVGTAVAAGFAVQVAQYIGAGEALNARKVIRHGLVASLLISLLIMMLGFAVAEPLPRWLGGDKVLWLDSSKYFIMFVITLPFLELNWMASSFLQCAGNMVVPSVLNAVMCLLDVVFNAIFIPKYGVLGAGIGTCLATVVICFVELWYCCFRYELLRINRKENCKFDADVLRRAFKIGAPVGVQSIAIPGSSVVATTIIAPLGAISIAAHTFAITAESLCYMPAHGISMAASTLVGQSVGAKDYSLARRYGYITVAFGCASMAISGIIMYIFCPYVFKFLTPVEEVRVLATHVLRIGLIAEPLFGVAMVASGALRGAEDTLVPSILNLFSVWVVRLGLAFYLVPIYGISGMWVAMTIELCFRGIIMFIRLVRSKYLNPDLAKKKEVA